MNKKKILTLVSLTFLLILTACLGKIFVQNMYPYDHANKTKVPKEVPAPYQEFFVESQDGDKIHSWYFKGDANRPVIVHFHGNGYNIGGAYEGGFFDLFKDWNLSLVIWDYPAYGRSSGKPSEKTLTSASLAVMEQVKAIFPNQKVILWGFSLGTGIATKTANLLQDQVDGLILAAPWDHSYKVAMELANVSKKQAKKAAKGNTWASADFAKDIFTRTMIFHGTKDTVIPFKLGKSLYESFPEGVAEFHPEEGAEHNNIMNKNFWDNFLRFVDGY